MKQGRRHGSQDTIGRMTAAALRAMPAAPTELRAEVIALWHEAQGDWHQAHAAVQDLETREALTVAEAIRVAS